MGGGGADDPLAPRPVISHLRPLLRPPVCWARSHPARAAPTPGTVVSAAMTERTPTPVRGVTAHAETGPDRPALVMGDAVRTYGELDRRARRLASVLKERGAGPHRPVAAVLPNGIEAFEVAVAAAMLNAPYLPVNWHLKADELAYILGDADVAVAVGEAGVTDEALAAALAQHPAGSLLVGADYEKEIESAAPSRAQTAVRAPSSCSIPRAPRPGPKGWFTPGLSDDSGRVRGMEGQVALWGWTPDDVYVMSGPRLPRLPSRVGIVLALRGGHHRHHVAFRGPLVPGGGGSPWRHPFRSWCRPISSASWRSPQRSAPHWTSRLLLCIVHAAAPCPVAVKYKMMEAFPPCRHPRALRCQ